MNKNLLRSITPILPIALLTLWSLLAQGLTLKSDTLHYEILLTNKMINSIHLNKKFIPSIDITAKRLILLSTNDQFYLLGWGGIVPLGKKTTGNIGSYAFTSDRLLMAIRNNELCSFDSAGTLSKLFKLPDEGMGISPGKYVMYVYDRNKNLHKNALYVIAKGGKYTRLFEVPAPIMSVAELNNSILFATGNALFSYDLKDKQMKALAVLEKEREITSIAVDSSNNRIYFSTQNAVYAIKDSTAVIITNEFGGILRSFNKGLIVFNPDKKLLIRITGLEDKITSKILALKAAAKDKKTQIKPAKTDSVSSVSEKPVKPALTKNETPVPPPPVPEKETLKQPEPEVSGSPGRELHVPANTIRAEKFISNASGNLVKGKTYILKKDFSQPIDFLNNLPDGSVLKLVGSDAGIIKSWKVVKPSDGSFALIDSKLYMYFEQAHVWLLKPTQ